MQVIGANLTYKKMPETNPIVEIRNNLCMWAIGKLPATLPEVQGWIVRLDNLLQQHEL